MLNGYWCNKVDDLISYADACCLNNERSNDVIPLNLLTLYQQARTDRNCNLATLWTSHFAIYFAMEDWKLLLVLRWVGKWVHDNKDFGVPKHLFKGLMISALATSFIISIFYPLKSASARPRPADR